MSRLIKTTPQGSFDRLFEECAARKQVNGALSSLFETNGYREVATPTLEYFDLFRLPGATTPAEKLYKITDRSGQIVVLRPDSTIPIARLVGTRLQNDPGPIRLYYSQKVYTESSGHNESEQSGIELIGEAGEAADMEALTLAAQALSLFEPDYKIEIGHAGIFPKLLEKLPCEPDIKREIKEAVLQKNNTRLIYLLKDCGDDPAAQTVKQLPGLFGEADILNTVAGGVIKDEITYLQRIFANLQTLGLLDKFCADLGIIQDNEYYTGVIFKGYISGRGAAVLSGGRYDLLHRQFGAPRPAIGFAVNNDILIDITLGQNRHE